MTPQEVRQKIVKRERWIKLVSVAGIIIVSLTILLAIPGMLISFLIAFVITFLFKPAVNYFERMGVARTVAIIIPFVLTGILIAGLSGFLIPKLTEQAAALQTELPKYIKGVSDLVQKHAQKLNILVSQYSDIDLASEVAAWIQKSTSVLVANVPNWISQLLSTMILAPFFSFFMLRDGRTVSRKILSLVPNNLFELSLNLLYQINLQMGAFIRARLLESALVGAVVWMGLYLMNFPYALFLAIFAGATNIIPYIGPIIGAAPGIIVALTNQDTAATVALVGMIYVIAQILDMLIVIPLVVAKIVDLHPVTVVIVIIVGSQIMGILGMIISIPVASIIKLTFVEFYNHVVDFRS